jgi:hypothetical protein
VLTARRLGLDGRKLGRLVRNGVTESAESGIELVDRAVAAGFVELGSGLDVEGAGVRERFVVMDLVGRDGDRVHVELRGGNMDLVELARAFWSRP